MNPTNHVTIDLHREVKASSALYVYKCDVNISVGRESVSLNWGSTSQADLEGDGTMSKRSSMHKTSCPSTA